MKRLGTFCIFWLLAFALLGCGRSTPAALPTPDGAARASPSAPISTTPSADQATVLGIALDEGSGGPLVEVRVALAEVYRQGEAGAYVLDTANSAGALTDAEGTFVIPNVPPGEYVIVVGDVMNRYAVIPDEDGKARTWLAEAGAVLDVGSLVVTLSNGPAVSGTPVP